MQSLLLSESLAPERYDFEYDVACESDTNAGYRHILFSDQRRNEVLRSLRWM